MIGRWYTVYINKYPQLSNREWLQDRVNSQPLRQIANEVGCSYSGVVYATRKFGIAVPHRSKHRFNPNKSATVKRALREKYPNGRFGALAANWRGGKRLQNGYYVIYTPDHPRAGRSRRVFEHILVAEQTLGRYLSRDEVVHHLNGDKLDNRPENLLVMLRSEHVKFHMHSGASIQAMLKKLETYEKKYGPLT